MKLLKLMKTLTRILLGISIITISACKELSIDTPISVAVEEFKTSPTITQILPIIRETSGIAESKTNLGYLWVNEDSGTPASLSLVSKTSGQTLKKVSITGATNRDWEDMCLSGSDIYIGDIGDNKLRHKMYTIYTFPEPAANATTVSTFKTIKFTYSDGKHDAEAFLVDPKTKDIIIITKNDKQSGIYKLYYPYSFVNTNRATLVGNLDYTGVVSAALSPDRKEIIIKTYTDLKLYTCTDKQSLEVALSYPSKTLPYVLEPQGEAVTFANDNSGFYTMSEKGPSTLVNLYWYKRK